MDEDQEAGEGAGSAAAEVGAAPRGELAAEAWPLMFGGLKNALTAWKAWGRLKEAKVQGKLRAAALALVGAVTTAIVAKLTTACPSLVANLGAIATAGGMGAWAYLQAKGKRPGQSIVLGMAGAGLASASIQVKMLCGPDFFTTLPTIATAGAWIGVMAWLRAPEAPPALQDE